MSYEEFFHLKDAPFRLTPDPDYFFPSGVHKEALDTMIYSIRSGEGFVMITGTPGVGKTLLIRKMLQELGDKVSLALVLNPTLSPRELLWGILDDLGLLKMEESEKLPKEKLLRMFRDHLAKNVEQGMKTIIIIDEAQNLPKDTLEELRMLSNLESDREKLLQIILVGQLELEERLKYDEMKQLAQRISIRFRLKPLSPEETGAYVRHRLEVAGDSMSVKFMPRVMGRIHALSSGIPRRINLICERALMAAYVDDEKGVSRKHLVRAIKSIEGDEDRIRSMPGWLWSTVGGAAVVLAALWVALQYNSDTIPQKNISQPAAIAQKERSAEVDNAGSQSPVSGLQPPASSLQSPVPDPQSQVPSGQRHEPIDKSNIKVNARVIPEPPPAPGIQEQAFTATPHFSSFTPDTPVVEEPVLRKPPGEFIQFLEKKEDGSLLPVNQFYLAVDRDKNMAQLWQGAASGPILKHEFQLDWRIIEGLYILGNDKKRGAFIFNPLLFQWGGYNLLNAAGLWDQVDDFVKDKLVPVIVYANSKMDKELLTGDIRAIRETIFSWTQAWRDRDVKALMGFYGNSFSTYVIDELEPQTYSFAELVDIRTRILGTSSSISLNTSSPVCLVDPQNPDQAIAVFRQEYMSDSYSDKGTKVLYLERVKNDPERPWKIVAKFFLPKEEM